MRPDARTPRPYVAGGAEDETRAGRYVAPTVPRGSDTASAMRRRREAALRCSRLASGVRDPLDGRVPRFGAGPSTFGLSPVELSAEVAARRRDGWRSWELRARFTDPREVASA